MLDFPIMKEAATTQNGTDSCSRNMLCVAGVINRDDQVNSQVYRVHVE